MLIKIPDTSGLVTKTVLNTKTTEVENKTPDTNSLVENKIPDNSKYITTP